MPGKEDLSLLCGHKYYENWVKTHIEGSMSPDEFDAWLDKYCIRCVHLPEDCETGLFWGDYF